LCLARGRPESGLVKCATSTATRKSRNIPAWAVIPAQAGIQPEMLRAWIPAFAGMTILAGRLGIFVSQ
jgi:hypothetical protein